MGYTLFISTQTQLSIDSWHKFSCEVNTHESLDAFTCKVRSLEKKRLSGHLAPVEWTLKKASQLETIQLRIKTLRQYQ